MIMQDNFYTTNAINLWLNELWVSAAFLIVSFVFASIGLFLIKNSNKHLSNAHGSPIFAQENPHANGYKP